MKQIGEKEVGRERERVRLLAARIINKSMKKISHIITEKEMQQKSGNSPKQTSKLIGGETRPSDTQFCIEMPKHICHAT